MAWYFGHDGGDWHGPNIGVFGSAGTVRAGFFNRLQIGSGTYVVAIRHWNAGALLGSVYGLPTRRPMVLNAKYADPSILSLPTISRSMSGDVACCLYAVFLGQDRSRVRGANPKGQRQSGVDWTTTLVIFGTSAALFAFASWRAARPAEFGKVRMVPWTPLSLVCALVAIFMIVHMINLLGVKTGR